MLCPHFTEKGPKAQRNWRVCRRSQCPGHGAELGAAPYPSLVTASSRICPSSWKHPAPRPFRGAPHLAIAKSWRSEKLRIGKEAQGSVRPCRQGHTAWAMEGCRRTDLAAPHLEWVPAPSSACSVIPLRPSPRRETAINHHPGVPGTWHMATDVCSPSIQRHDSEF